MTDFKVGNKVKILNGRNSAAHTKGMEGVVTDDRYRNLVDPYYIVKLINGEMWNYKKEELKLIKEKKEFKMGDLVTVLESNHGAPEETIGRRGVIRNFDSVYAKYCVEFSHRESPFAFRTEQWWYSEDELELAIPPSQVDESSVYSTIGVSALKPIEEGMRILCKTKEEWEALLTNLELREYEWQSHGSRPTRHINYFTERHEQAGAYICIESNKRISWGNRAMFASHKLTPVSEVLDFNIGRKQTVNQPTDKEETTMTNEIKEGQRVIHEGCGTYIDASEGLLVDRIEADGTTRVESIATGEKEWVITEYLISAEIEVGEFVEVLKDHRIFRVGDVCEVIEVDEKDPTGFNYLVEKEDSTRWIYKDEVRLASLWYEVEREENIGSENGTLIVEQNIKTKELRITRGCFKKKTLDEFEEAVKRKSEGDPHRVVYEFLIRKYKEKYPQPAEKKYYVKLSEGMVEQLNGVSGLYLNFLGSREEHVFASKEEVGTCKTQFTQTEAEGWVEKLDKLELEIIEVKEEEPQW